MTLLGVHVKADTRLVRKGLQDLGAEIPKVGKLQIYQVMRRSKARLTKKGKRVTYPVPWDNIRQKIKVILMLKAANNLPYRRKGDYQRGFKIIQIRDGYDLINENPNAEYIGGNARGKRQSRIFKGRYPIVREVVEEEAAKLPGAVVQHIKLVTKQKGLGSDAK